MEIQGFQVLWQTAEHLKRQSVFPALYRTPLHISSLKQGAKANSQEPLKISSLALSTALILKNQLYFCLLKRSF